VSAAVRINREGIFSSPSAESEDGLIPVHEITDFDQLDGLLDRPVVRFRADGFADGRVLSLARQLRLRGYTGCVELVGDIVPDQFSMATAAGIDFVEITAAHAARCQEPQWRAQVASSRFGYQRRLGRASAAR